MENRKWSKEEIEYLQDKWGIDSIKNMAKKFNRTELAIVTKANRLKLGAYLENGDYITFNELLNALSTKPRFLREKLIKNGCPIKYKRVKNNKFKIIYIKDFWKWAENNKHILDLSELERNTLGKEPNWVDQKRKEDIEINEKTKIYHRWTPKEDEYLVFLLRQHKYTYEDISIRLGRGIETIASRIKHKGIKERPLTATTRWSKEEIEILNKCIKEKIPYEIISKEINKTTKQIRAKLYKLYGTESFNKVNEILKNAS
ncbi:hypothetical protein [Romboutsia sp. 1001713B170131_170501_G6]|uniref:hypothetical protein n=1 Tax=Romboutsia sp. 1001713B170131_170501_G6 TaxID=2787108 RepID=UPI0018AA1F51|nr:hypothetical protein [Romboutsia sp. 1001713B170131_170501_G6]